MSAIKVLQGGILWAATESVYLAGAPLTGSRHAVQWYGDEPLFQIQYATEGTIGMANGAAGMVRPTEPTGRFTTAEVRMQGKGLGAAYSQTALVPNMHALLLACGMSASLQSNTWVFKPTPLDVTQKSAALNVWNRKEFMPVSGVIGTFTMAADSTAPTNFTFTLSGVPGTVVDQPSLPLQFYSASAVRPPANVDIGLSIGAYTTPVVKSYSFEFGMEITPQANMNAAGGHNGFNHGRRSPVFKVTIETPLKSTFDPDEELRTAASRAISLTVGKDANNIEFLSLPQAVLTGVTRSGEGKTATVELTYTPYVSVPDANDDVVLTFQ